MDAKWRILHHLCWDKKDSVAVHVRLFLPVPQPKHHKVDHLKYTYKYLKSHQILCGTESGSRSHCLHLTLTSRFFHTLAFDYRERLSVSNLRSENNLPTFRPERKNVWPCTVSVDYLSGLALNWRFLSTTQCLVATDTVISSAPKASWVVIYTSMNNHTTVRVLGSDNRFAKHCFKVVLELRTPHKAFWRRWLVL